MVSPPKYQQISQNDEEQGRSSDELPTYPPNSSTAIVADIPPLPPGERSNIVYTFVPRYPVLGDKTDALGVLGLDRNETTQIVQRGFPLLASYPPSRIEFLAPVEVDRWGKVVDDRWAIVMNEAWGRFKKEPPVQLKVQITDLSGDAEAREEYLKNEKEKKEHEEARVFFLVMGSILAVGAAILFIIWLAGGFSSNSK